MTGTRRFVATGSLLALAVLLGGCWSTKVYREPGTSSQPPSKPRPGVTTTVRRGDTLFAIASRNGVRQQDLAAWNGLDPPYTIYPGQKLRLYPAGKGGGTGTTRPTAAATKPSTPTPPAPKPAAPAASDIKWRWPADGELIGRYVAGEPTKQGVDIAGASGAPVRAAADGVVVYSGSGLVGYGELIIIKHNEQWLSAYGHNRNRLVNEGQLVRSGQQIAEMGRSGAPREMLHFEVRYNGKPVDPLIYLPRR
ncbi:peptidoglycan DD-metalloendopeptidase family protein [Lysobacter arvi]|uniref:Peptidoglycan DD-metalloendopeptidase family protein n=1 Tax=Lysobacter arvi TaxID=3038776 RepID=A0ABU1CC54_9GAMM|nr:peptidoglycan DD-metalloendopeptidase family protein [Lysobacter arvi]MDR0182741.1 peptidoglycan DD-metalloendopeptidase family protein [Lysobacter arvi]